MKQNTLVSLLLIFLPLIFVGSKLYISHTEKKEEERRQKSEARQKLVEAVASDHLDAVLTEMGKKEFSHEHLKGVWNYTYSKGNKQKTGTMEFKDGKYSDKGVLRVEDAKHDQNVEVSYDVIGDYDIKYDMIIPSLRLKPDGSSVVKTKSVEGGNVGTLSAAGEVSMIQMQARMDLLSPVKFNASLNGANSLTLKNKKIVELKLER